MPRTLLAPLVVLALGAAIACGDKKPPTARPTTPPTTGAGTGTSTSGSGTATPERPLPPDVGNPTAAPSPASSDPYATESPDVINAHSPLKPVFFLFDSDQLDDAARKVLDEDAQVLKKYGTWVITIEGHCDERGTAEYNLALGERRALAAKNYLLSVGISADRFRTVSYGKEFPFDPGHDEGAWSKNRRAHLMLTSKE